MLCFVFGPPRIYASRHSRLPLQGVEESHVEAGSNTSILALQVVGGDEKGSLESETVKCGRESHGTRT
jgi:hypothetical protein